MHWTAHLADDVQNMQCDLSHYTAFPFENYLQFLRKKIKSGFNPLVQLCNRVAEERSMEAFPVKLPEQVEILSPKKILQECDTTIEKIRYKDVTLSKKAPNNTVMMKSGDILVIDGMTLPCSERDLNKIQITGKTLQKLEMCSTILQLHQN
ncbi:hypothetical protein QAD02_003833 [Eretmocerus hayati]|uniref:Uncharacterized protein n=1 Tax=Eretmocerus hayati TaxID=131215 RepID=A0ACC2NQJ7_9HYME|nr:hypothetical protein QAD02_003833 [Eretmocerus hayati]